MSEPPMTSNSHSDDVAFIQALAELLRDNDLSEVHVKRDYPDEGALNVRVSRVKTPEVVSVTAQPAPFDLQLPAAAPVAQSAPAEAGSGSMGDPANHPGAIVSPMVGTVYLQPEPGSEPFISVGTKVAEGQTLLIIEAMKTMNQIPSPRAGTVSRILVEDGGPVEFGGPLIILE